MQQQMNVIARTLIVMLAAVWLSPVAGHACSSCSACDTFLTGAGKQDGTGHAAARHKTSADKPCTMKICFPSKIPALTLHFKFFHLHAESTPLATSDGCVTPAYADALFRPPRSAPQEGDSRPSRA
ncbi:hypothetical protein [Candidatus Desulfovibrio trichonymphae]|uniref:Secreted protein n=1 Tax=Candidatus Desulfovibrio trichonymphae TaxID=1725232 RepID=A0A1J1E2A9_9BACT|nr:hypothetical protein [Candidatus Desulfovibrio trichonymphae]BAV91568.1 hypothetical protein RSDT_0056 [Candidatus Desulfovibrio trichonymphae]GHU89551.1 hypothetical protein AGMMS49925_00200 [Deltaproteobacteria bacterium]GHU97042.1 hypothetical protein AGMMS50248_00090 [Deltaproteobacteria bacterium]